MCGVLGAALVVAGLAFAGSALADPTGVWLNDRKDSHIRIYACENDKDELCGEIVWLKRPNGKDGKPRRDVENEDKSLRGRQVLGLQVISGMEYEGGGEWEDGDIYNPRDGETYDAELEEVDANTLKVSGCVWFLCKEQIWTRVE
ncbi:MAG: DUF2147 domain-containing protein [Gemmatimonadota bacterium]|nr:DUF2147 domain-containing protein [Gemmatimonadota bacterium]